MLTPDTFLQNRYRILRHIGGGGMGLVYLAEDTRLPGRMYAIKEMSPAQLPPDDRTWASNGFRQEAQMLATLDHAGLTAVTDFFPEEGNLYLVMDYVRGQTLEEILHGAPDGRLPQGQAFNIVRQLCDVLEYLHGQDPPVIFRDLKPSNVMLTPEGQVKLVDFGIARFFKPAQSQDTVTLGTPGYAAPEQWGAAGQSDARSDIYGLGVLLLRLATGYDPIPNPFPLPQPRDVMPQISPKTEYLILRATPIQPGARYQNVAEFRRDIDTSSCGSQVELSKALKPLPHRPSKPKQDPEHVPGPRKRARPWVWLALLASFFCIGLIGVIIGYRYIFARPMAVPIITTRTTNTMLPTTTPQQVFTATSPRPTSTTRSPSPTSTQRATATPSSADQEAALLHSLRYREENGDVVFADRVASPPILDGRLNEWGVLRYQVSHEFHDRNGELSGNWNGASDLYGRFCIQWDADNLYLGLEVTDDVHVQIEKGRLMYKGDEVEIQIDTNLASDFSDTDLSNDDGQIGLSAGDFGANASEAYIWQLNGKEHSGADIQVATRETSNGYTLEAMVPWWTLGRRLGLETAVGFTLCLSDNDVPDSAQQQTLLCTTPGRKWGDPTTWGTLVLVDWK